MTVSHNIVSPNMAMQQGIPLHACNSATIAAGPSHPHAHNKVFTIKGIIAIFHRKHYQTCY